MKNHTRPHGSKVQEQSDWIFLEPRQRNEQPMNASKQGRDDAAECVEKLERIFSEELEAEKFGRAAV